jgi:FtsZ-interacting cell division protein ZipA
MIVDPIILRLSLLFVAALVLIGVFVWTQAQAMANEHDSMYLTPQKYQDVTLTDTNSKEEKIKQDKKPIILRLARADKTHITGDDLLLLKERYNLIYDSSNQHLIKKKQNKVLYSICSSYNPGVLPANLQDFSTYGISAFMVFDNNQNKDDFEIFAEDLQNMGEDIGAILLDVEHNKVSLQTLNYIREYVL